MPSSSTSSTPKHPRSKRLPSSPILSPLKQPATISDAQDGKNVFNSPRASMTRRFDDLQLHQLQQTNSHQQDRPQARQDLAMLDDAGPPVKRKLCYESTEEENDRGSGLGLSILDYNPQTMAETMQELDYDHPSSDMIILEPTVIPYHPSKGDGHPARPLSNVYQSFTSTTEPFALTDLASTIRAASPPYNQRIYETTTRPHTLAAHKSDLTHHHQHHHHRHPHHTHPRKRQSLSSLKSSSPSTATTVTTTATSASPTTDPTWWRTNEITGHMLSPSDVLAGDDGTGINGIGFRPTATQAALRSQKRRKQVEEWRKREEKEDRERRREKRKGSGGSGNGSVGSGIDADRVGGGIVVAGKSDWRGKGRDIVVAGKIGAATATATAESSSSSAANDEMTANDWEGRTQRPRGRYDSGSYTDDADMESATLDVVMAEDDSNDYTEKAEHVARYRTVRFAAQLIAEAE